MPTFADVIDEACRNFKQLNNGKAPDTVFLTAIGMKTLRDSIGGYDREWIKNNLPETFDDGDEVMGLTVYFTDEKLLYGFRLASSQPTQNPPLTGKEVEDP